MLDACYGLLAVFVRTRDFTTNAFPSGSRRFGGQRKEIERVSEVLQLAVIVKQRRAFSIKAETFQKGSFLVGNSGAELCTVEEFLQAWLDFERRFGFHFTEFEPLEVTARQSAVQYDFHAEAV
jgi:hypothetical protein